MDGGIDVCIESYHSDTPHCPHGPTLLFERYSNGKLQRFYACSACRDRKDCSFFQLENAKISEETLQARKQYNVSCQPQRSHTEAYNKYKQVKRAEVSRRLFCMDCSVLLLSQDGADHRSHQLKSDVTDDLLATPTKLLVPLDNNKKNAQYLFSERAIKFTISTIKSLGFKKVLCIGAPRIHEAIVRQNARNGDSSCGQLKSLLLDIDNRFEQFYSTQEFCRYNMFNHHFFHGSAAQSTFCDFLTGELCERMVVVTDPPFGGLIEVLAETLKVIMKQWKDRNQDRNEDLGVIWFFPYFMETRIKQCLPSFTMLDYKVAYDNHASFTNTSKGRKQGSPVRIFTNLSPALVKLPSSEGYRFCELCKRYVSAENIHCYKCDACMSKDGTRYVHCLECDRCVKPSRVHCGQCERCELPGHKCGQALSTGCHICGSPDHKRRECPQKSTVTQETNGFMTQHQSARKKRKSTETSPMNEKKRKMISKIIKKKRQKKNKKKGKP